MATEPELKDWREESSIEYDPTSRSYVDKSKKQPPPRRPRVQAWLCEDCTATWTGQGKYRIAMLHGAVMGHKVRRDRMRP